MAKKKNGPSYTKHPANKARPHKMGGTAPKLYTRNPGHIGNKLKRSEMYGRYLQDKRTEKRQNRQLRIKEAAALGQDVVKKTPRTIDNTREVEISTVDPNDPEVQADEASDEFAPYLNGEKVAKLLITTRPKPSQNLFYFIADLQKLVPNLHYYPRQDYSVREICQFATNRDFTHVLVLSEKSKVCNGLTISLLPYGPTAFFKLTNVVTNKDIPNHGAVVVSHIPELNLHGFGTRLGHRVGRFFASCFPPPVLKGRQVITFHNQRDYIFVRQHRYIFREKNGATTATSTTTTTGDESSSQTATAAQQKNKKNTLTKKRPPPPLDTTTAPTVPNTNMPVLAKLQELGPRFTLKLRWLQAGTFATQTGEYEYFHKRKEMDTSRRKFHL
jgi:ribosome production factor 1